MKANKEEIIEMLRLLISLDYENFVIAAEKVITQVIMQKDEDL